MQSLTVGDLRFEVSSDVGLRLGAAYRSYAAFTDLPAGADELRVRVSLERGDANARPADAACLYDAPGAWSIWGHPGGYHLRMGERDPLWVADADPAFEHVALRCGAGLGEPDDGQVANVLQYPLDQLLLMHRLAPCGGALIHAAGAVIGGGALVFPGVSGAGKSTLAGKLEAGGIAELLSGDRVVLRAGDGGAWVAHGTPWPGDDWIARRASAPLRALLFVARGDGVTITRLDAESVIERLLPVLSIPWYEPIARDQLLASCGRLIAGVPCYELRYGLDADVVGAVHALP